MIRPEDIPRIEGDMDAMVETALRVVGDSEAVSQSGIDANNRWHALEWCYQAPEAPQLLNGMEEFEQRARRMGSSLNTVGEAFKTFGADAKRMQARFEQLRAEAYALQAAVGAFNASESAHDDRAGLASGRTHPSQATEAPDWHTDPELAERSRRLDSDVAHAVEEWEHIQDTCARAIDSAYFTGHTGAMLAAASTVVPALGLLGASGPQVPSLPPAGTSPQAVNAWWHSLHQQQHHDLITRHPEMIGNLDGVPAWARHQANVNRLFPTERALETEHAQLLAERDRLRAALGDNWFGGQFDDADDKLKDVDARLAATTDKLGAITAIRGVLNKGNRQLLVFDTSGKRAKAATAVGDVDKADHVGVFTPGYDSTVPNGLESYDRHMEGLQLAADDQAQFYGDRGSVATVTWIGYEPPQPNESLDVAERSVTNDDLAHRGAPKLASFNEGLNASRERDPHLTALGHSYGSLTTGEALQHPNTGVDDAVFFGSPGLNAQTADDLRIPQDHAYVIEAREDAVADIGRTNRFGTDPNQMRGAQGLSAKSGAGPEGPLKESVGHSEYLNGRTMSQYNIANIVAGTPEHAVRDNGIGAGDSAIQPPPVLSNPGLRMLQ